MKNPAPQPQIRSQGFVKVKTGHKHVTEIDLGPHRVTLIAYPNHGYYVTVNGETIQLKLT